MTRGHNRSGGLTETLSNRPFIVGLLFIGTYFVPFLVLIGVALAYIFRKRPEEEWEISHFQYLIRTFWIAVLSAIGLLVLGLAIAVLLDIADVTVDQDSALLTAAFLGGVTMMGVLILCGVRIIMSLMNSIAHKPMPNPSSRII